MRPRRPCRGGRPCKLTLAIGFSLCEAARQGGSLDQAARQAGVASSTLFRWLAAGRKGDPRYVPLVEALDRARKAPIFSFAPLLDWTPAVFDLGSEHEGHTLTSASPV